MEELKIVQHNVLKWTPQRTELSNIYAQFNPDVILLNATGMKQDDRIKIYTYNVYQKNATNEDHAGVAIAIRKTIKHKVLFQRRCSRHRSRNQSRKNNSSHLLYTTQICEDIIYKAY